MLGSLGRAPPDPLPLPARVRGRRLGIGGHATIAVVLCAALAVVSAPSCANLSGLSGGDGPPDATHADVAVPDGPDLDSTAHPGDGDATPLDVGVPQEAKAGGDGCAEGGCSTDSGEPVDAAADVSCPVLNPVGVDYCTIIRSLPTPPVIDGVLDCGVPLWAMPLTNWLTDGPPAVPTPPPGVQIKVGAAWRTDGLYLFVSVTRPGTGHYPAPPGTSGLYCGDAIEYFVDSSGVFPQAPAYNQPGTTQFICAAPATATTESTTAVTTNGSAITGQWSSSQFVVVGTPNGFDGEAFIVAQDLGLPSWSLVAGGMIGLDIAVDLGDPASLVPQCPRLGQFPMNLPALDAACPIPACNVDTFCEPQLEP